MVKTSTATQFRDALGSVWETIDRLAVEAVEEFAIKAARKLCDYSPVAKKPVPMRGLFKANWRLGTIKELIPNTTQPDPQGHATAAAMAAEVQRGPRQIAGWSHPIYLYNGGRDAEEIGDRYRIVGRVADELIREYS